MVLGSAWGEGPHISISKFNGDVLSIGGRNAYFLNYGLTPDPDGLSTRTGCATIKGMREMRSKEDFPIHLPPKKGQRTEEIGNVVDIYYVLKEPMEVNHVVLRKI